MKKKDKRAKKHIYILGAGIAGLIVAYELKKLGHRVTVFEGSHRPGGRIFTYHFTEGKNALYGELGAMRFPLSHDYTLHYIREFQLDGKLKPFIGVFGNDNCFLKFKNNILKTKDFLASTKLTVQKMEILKEIIATFLPDDIAKLAQEIDMQALNFRLNKNTPPSFVKLIEELAQGLISINPSLELSLQYFLKRLNSEFFYLDGGMDQLPKTIATHLGTDIVYNTEVCKLSNLNNKAEITLLCRGKYETISCDYVVCTLPFTAMRDISLQNFSFKKLEAIHCLKYIAACKTLLLCKNKFWQDNYNIQGGASITDSMVRQIYYPFTQGNRGIILTYTVGENANYLSNLPPPQRIIHAKEAIGFFHKEIHEQDIILNSMSLAWDNYKWSKGGFSFMWTKEELVQASTGTASSKKSDLLYQLYKATTQPEGRIFFAGEHCSFDQGWIQGAIISALETVNTIVLD